MKSRIIRRSGDAIVTTSTKVGKHGSEDLRTHRIKLPSIPTPCAVMRVEAGLTKQPKQYEAVRAGVTVEIPCGLSDKEMKAAYERASAIVETCLEKQMERTLAFSEEF